MATARDAPEAEVSAVEMQFVPHIRVFDKVWTSFLPISAANQTFVSVSP
jgi:hypothetical protein